MAPPKENAQTVSYRRTHNLLLASRLLNQRDTPSPFTLVFDSLNQSSKSLLREYIRRAAFSKIKVHFVSFETPKKPTGVETFIRARRKPLLELQNEILQAIRASQHNNATERSLIIIDTLHPIINGPAGKHLQQQYLSLPTFLGPLISQNTTLLATYHADLPLAVQSDPARSYGPDASTLLNYIATTLITVHSPVQIFRQKRNMDKSLPIMTFGFAEGMEGVLVGLGSNPQMRRQSTTAQQEDEGIMNNNNTTDGIILELEHRRKSGRGMIEWFYLPPPPPPSSGGPHVYKERIILLEDHPKYTPEDVKTDDLSKETEDVDALLETTFSLGLTEKQKQDREGVVLPYFDAQKEGGGTGGRILYTPGREDDWDEEEDEI